MPIYQQLIDFNQAFNQLIEPPIIINDLSNASEEDREAIKEMLITRYSGDMISLLPSCRCGAIKGEFSLGVKCDKCGHYVASTLENDIQSSVWYRRPIGVAPLINPIVFIMLRNRFKTSGFSVIQWLVDSTYKPTVKSPAVLIKIQQAGIIQGYNNFVNNFDAILAFLFTLREFKLKRGEVDYLQLLLKTERQKIFSEYIPLANKTLFIVEKTHVGIYLDEVVKSAIDFLLLLVSIDKSFHDQSTRTKENRTGKALGMMADFFEDYFKNNLSPKTAQFRRHIYGSRTVFSFRAVISSLTGTHRYDCLECPWGIGITAFRPHLINKLMKRGMDLNSSIGLLMSHVSKYDPVLDELLQELIRESKDPRGIPILANRNPSLLQGSIQRTFISKFKTDPQDTTVGLPISICVAFNAD